MLLPVIGLEVHVQLNTATKMFCGDAVEFGAPPNSHVCPVCLGLPGSLPVVNERAVELGVRATLGLGCTVHLRSVFVRKSYFYPDLPRGYQITQHDRPVATGGFLEIPAGDHGEQTVVRIRRVHLEEDTAKSLHERVAGATALDLNRAGIPLAEIVTEPDLRSPAGARAFLTRLRQALQYLGVSDCSMEEGSLRVDANISLRRPSGGMGTRTEIKNLNSFGNVQRALSFEIERQERVLESGGAVEPQTLLWDAERGEARPLRSKEETRDYRYFPEPDLGPLVLDAAWIEGLRSGLPEMPWTRASRLAAELGIPGPHAAVLSADRELGDYFEAVVAEGADAGEAAKWVLGEVLALRKEGTGSLADLRVAPPRLASLLRALQAGSLSRPGAKRVLAGMAESGEAWERIAEREGLTGLEDSGAPETWAEAAVAGHPDEVRRFREGDGRLLDFFMGEAMRLARGRVDPGELSRALRRRLDA